MSATAVVYAVLISWVGLSFVAGVFAAHRGFSFIATFILSLLFSPLAGFVSVLVRTPRSTT